MKIALVDESGTIINLVLGTYHMLSENSLYVSKNSVLKIGDVYDEQLAAPDGMPMPMVTVILDNVNGVLDGFDDNDNEFTCMQGEPLTMSGPMPVVDQKLRIPLRRTDTGREMPVLGVVQDGVLSITLTFPTAGFWECNNELINRTFDVPQFDMSPLKFTVL